LFGFFDGRCVMIIGLFGSLCAFVTLILGFSLGRTYEREKRKPNASIPICVTQESPCPTANA